MNRVSALLAAVAIGAIAAPAQATTIFNFQFDEQGIVPGDGPLKGAIVGRGTFASPIDLGPGLYRLSDLAGFTVNFRDPRLRPVVDGWSVAALDPNREGYFAAVAARDGEWRIAVKSIAAAGLL